jgi:hypothetical protein
MPNESIDSVLVSQFADNLHVEQQQISSLFRPHADIVPLNAEDFYYDSIGILEDTEVTTRNAVSVATDANFSRRRAVSREFSVTVHVGQSDVERMMRDPQGQLVNACKAAIERRFDRLYYDALFADVKVGKHVSQAVTTTFAADGGRTVDATAGLTYAKLLEAIQNQIDDECGTDGLVFAGTGDEHTSMMGLTQLTSGDYSRQMVVDQGTVQKALGMDLLWFAGGGSSPIIKVNGSGYRECVIHKSKSIRVGMTRNPQVTLKDRSDLVNVKQIQVTMVMAAVRKEGKLVQKVTTTP